MLEWKKSVKISAQMNERYTIHVSEAGGYRVLTKKAHASLRCTFALLRISLAWEKRYISGSEASCCSGIYISSLSLGMCATSSLDAISAQ